MIKNKNNLFARAARIVSSYRVNAKFCRLIESHPCIYDPLRRREIVNGKVLTPDEAWRSIARHMDWTVLSCKKRWKNIRKRYFSSHRKRGQKPVVPYYLHKELKFLDKYYPTDTNNEESIASSKESIDLLDSNDGGSTSRISETVENIQEIEQGQEDEPYYSDSSTSLNDSETYISEEFGNSRHPRVKDPDCEFLNSMLPEMEIMNRRQKVLFKAKIFEALEQVLRDTEDFPQNLGSIS